MTVYIHSTDLIDTSRIIGEWARVRHGDERVVLGEVLIADLLRLGSAACSARQGLDGGPPQWSLWQDDEGLWHASGPLRGPGCKWWSNEVTYREIGPWITNTQFIKKGD